MSVVRPWASATREWLLPVAGSAGWACHHHVVGLVGALAVLYSVPIEQVGWLAAAVYGTFVPAQALTQGALARLQGRGLALGGAIVACLGCAGLLLARDFRVAMAAAALLGVGSSFSWVVLAATSSSVKAQERVGSREPHSAERFEGRYNAVANLGMALIGMTVVACGAVDARLGLAVAAMTCAGAVAIVWFAMPTGGGKPPRRRLVIRPERLAVRGGVLGFLAVVGIVGIQVPLAAELWLDGRVALVAAMPFGAIAAAAGSWYAGRTAGPAPARPVVLGCALGAAAWGLAALAPSGFGATPGLVAFVLLLSATGLIGTAVPAAVARRARHEPEARAFTSTLRSLGQLVGTLAGTAAYSAVGWTGTARAGLAFEVIVVIAGGWFIAHLRRTTCH